LWPFRKVSPRLAAPGLGNQPRPMRPRPALPGLDVS
jgi:hypothetical protein